MKFIFLAISLIATLSLKGQSFVATVEATSIIQSEKSSDEATLSGLNPNSVEYQQLKNNLKAFKIVSDHIEGGVGVEESIMMSVIELDEEEISPEDYFTNNFPNGEYLRIKNRLIQLLEE